MKQGNIKDRAITKIWRTCFICLGFLSFSNQALADNEQSKIDLARVNNLIQKTYILIDQAAINNDKNARYQFNYLALKQDLQMIQQGISNYINQIQVSPNHIQLLKAIGEIKQTPQEAKQDRAILEGKKP